MSDPKLCIACAWYRRGRPNDCIEPRNSRIDLCTGEAVIPFGASGMRHSDIGCKAAGDWFKPLLVPANDEAA